MRYARVYARYDFLRCRRKRSHACHAPDARAVVEAVRRAVEASPSSCNRQTSRVYYLHSLRAKAEVLR